MDVAGDALRQAAHACPSQGVGRQKRRFGKGLFEILADGQRLAEESRPRIQSRHQLLRIDGAVVGGTDPNSSLGAAAALYGREFPQLDAVKALVYFEEGDAKNVDETTRDVLRHHAASWDGFVSRMG